MTKTISAIYEKGIFRPTEPVELSDGARVTLTLSSPPVVHASASIAKMLAEIAALGPDAPPPNDGLCGSADHDTILYGGPKGAL